MYKDYKNISYKNDYRFRQNDRNILTNDKQLTNFTSGFSLK